MALARRGHTVLFHGPPERDAKGIVLQHVERAGALLNVVRSPAVAPGLAHMPAYIRNRLERRWLERLEVAADCRIDAVWLFENSRFFDMRFAGSRVRIYQQVDLNQNFHPEMAAATADLSIAISGPIERRLQPAAGELIRISHGCPRMPEANPEPNGLDEVFSMKTVNAVLTGNLDLKYIDLRLLEDLVDGHPGVQFHFVGHFTEGRGLHAAVGDSPNTFFWGRQPSESMPCILRRADVLLVTYLADEHLDQLANPHKVMEYLASGRCVLATRTLDYEERPGLIEIAQSREDFLRRFSEIVASPSSWNTPELIAKRQAYAADNTYSRQVDRIAEALGPKGHLIS